jgi:hypothetical protein
MSDAEKLALRARLQGGRVADPNGVAPEVVGGYGELLDPREALVRKPLYPYPPGPRRKFLPEGVVVIMVLAA